MWSYTIGQEIIWQKKKAKIVNLNWMTLVIQVEGEQHTRTIFKSSIKNG